MSPENKDNNSEQVVSDISSDNTTVVDPGLYVSPAPEVVNNQNNSSGIKVEHSTSQNIPNDLNMDSYYDNHSKGFDFFLGFIGPIVAVFLLGGYVFASNLGLFIPLVVAILLLVVSKIIGRRYIAIGVISLILIPLLLWGSCLLTAAINSVGMGTY